MVNEVYMLLLITPVMFFVTSLSVCACWSCIISWVIICIVCGVSTSESGNLVPEVEMVSANLLGAVPLTLTVSKVLVASFSNKVILVVSPAVMVIAVSERL